METISPRDETELCDAVAAAIAAASPLEILGSGSRRALGRPVEASAILSTAHLTGVVFYEPSELVLCARAATPVRDIVDLLAAQNQELAFEPLDHGRFYRAGAGCGTLGGLVATNASGPRRIKTGAARDHVLGLRGVTGRGDLIKSGGRVMKNVTGYDLSKLATGSFGTLLVLSEATLKVLPRPESQTTALAAVADEALGLALLREATALPFEVSGFALLPASPMKKARILLRVEGSSASVGQARDEIAGWLKDRAGPIEMREDVFSRTLWRDIRDGAFVNAESGPVWRVSAAPSDGGAIVQELRGAGAPITAHYYDWAGGLVWLAMEEAPDAHAQAVRAAVDRRGGHATLMRAAADIRADVFHPQAAALAALTKRVKESFDPLHILNRGKLRPDF